MADEESPDLTLNGAHTRAADAREARAGAERVLVDDSMAELAALIGGQGEAGEQLSLPVEDDDEGPLFAGPVRHVADQLAARGGRGRPKGSKNRANQLFRDYLLSKGYRHPGLNLADLANANPELLARELCCEHVEAMQLIVKANAELLPYFESRRPQEVNVSTQSLGVLVVRTSGAAADDGAKRIDLTGGAGVDAASTKSST